MALVLGVGGSLDDGAAVVRTTSAQDDAERVVPQGLVLPRVAFAVVAAAVDLRRAEEVLV